MTSSRLANQLGIFGKLASLPLPGGYMRAADRVAIAIFGAPASPPVRETFPPVRALFSRMRRTRPFLSHSPYFRAFVFLPP
jgi:hypothetical protein